MCIRDRCDDFTREFLAREGVVLAPNTEIPDGLIDEGPSVLGTIGMGLRGVGGKRVFEDANASPLGVVVAGAAAETKARSIHWSPYDRVGVVNADP